MKTAQVINCLVRESDVSFTFLPPPGRDGWVAFPAQMSSPLLESNLRTPKRRAFRRQ